MSTLNASVRVHASTNGIQIMDTMFGSKVLDAELNELMSNTMCDSIVTSHGKYFTRIFYKVDGKWITASGKTVEEATYNLLEPTARKLAVFDKNIIGQYPTGHILRYMVL